MPRGSGEAGASRGTLGGMSRKRTGGRTGRPSKIDETPVRKLIIDAVAMGLSIPKAVDLARGEAKFEIGQTTVYDWLARSDERGEAFRKEIAHARARGALLKIGQIQQAAERGRVTRHFDAEGRVVEGARARHGR